MRKRYAQWGNRTLLSSGEIEPRLWQCEHCEIRLGRAELQQVQRDDRLINLCPDCAGVGNRLATLEQEHAALKAENARMKIAVNSDSMHPNGRCGCAGEGTCQWCQMTEAKEERDAALALVKEARTLIRDEIMPRYVELFRETGLGQPNDSVAVQLAQEFVFRPLPDALAEAGARVRRMEEALREYAACSDGCTCGDGWDHDSARAALGAPGTEDEG